jgi:hypothetical protein
MRLIDAELLEDQFGISDEDILAKEEIRYAPTVDAVVVTRCEDCKHPMLFAATASVRMVKADVDKIA